MKRLVSFCLCLCFFVLLINSAPIPRITEAVTLEALEDTRVKYNFNVIAMKGGKVTYNNILSENEGIVDLSVTSIPEGMIITIQLIETDTGVARLTEIGRAHV